ncbi:uncharacterized protein LOC125532036 isoform X2 [Triticum urartu]|nr:uncharacterized protein LOC125508222 isoform X2 [Triticum urartu]XP_048552165.1 uncharacterized protein LOC125532036 isoform X2 [Triticum urartu]
MWRGRSQEHFHPILAVASGQDLKDELTLGGELTLNLWRCIHHMLSQKEKIIYCGWLDRFRGIFDPRFVASAQLNYNCVSVHPVDHMKLIFLTFPLQEELCRDAGETNWDYISTMMHPDVMGCRIDWVKKFMFLVNFMDCWPLYILDTEKKIMIVHEMTETDPACEMKIKHEALAKKFQHRFCTLFNDMFGAGLVETRGLSFVYPLVAQHGQCSSGVYILHYFVEFIRLYLQSTLTQAQIEHLRKKFAYEIVTMKGNNGDIPELLHDIIID